MTTIRKMTREESDLEDLRIDLQKKFSDQILEGTKKLVLERGIATEAEFEKWSNDGCDENDPTGRIWDTYDEVMEEVLKPHLK